MVVEMMVYMGLSSLELRSYNTEKEDPLNGPLHTDFSMVFKGGQNGSYQNVEFCGIVVKRSTRFRACMTVCEAEPV
uniref:Uncharacterized protein n=1 Tax=Amphimedon queenslandica TaxID=400682 RepID=A0A1X7TXB2_AMPQE